MAVTDRKVETKPQESPATPLAKDILELLRKQLLGGSFGLGLGPLQQEAGTALRQFIESGGGRFDMSQLVKDLETIQDRRVGEGAADLRESFGILGSRFGDPLARAEGDFRREAETEFSATLGKLFQQAFQARQNRLLTGINLLQAFGNQNIEPFLRLAGAGILPDHVIVSPSTLEQLSGFLAAGGQLFSGIRGSGGFGGSGPTNPGAPVNPPI